MNSNLQELREQWEGIDAHVVAEKKSNEFTLLVVIRDSLEGGYRCFRYFQIGTDWAVSCDGSGVLPEVAMKWLCNPSASTCRAS